MKSEIDNNTFLNYSKGKYSYNDYLKVRDWFNKTEQKESDKEILFNQWIGLFNESARNYSSFGHIFEKIQYKILLEEKKSEKKHMAWNFYRQIAAILLIPLLVVSLWYYFSSASLHIKSQNENVTQAWIEIYAPEGARVKFSLPDSSFGWLNSGAKLRYPAVFSNHRRVELAGEAYFDVKHLQKSDFTVSVADMDIKVLGTKFDVSAYPDDHFTSVVLKEGKVEINGKNTLFNHTLLPDEKITFSEDSKSLKSTKVDANRLVGWKDGYLIIENEPLGEVVNRIGRWYNVEFDIQNDKLKNYRFKATFKDEPLEEVLRLIAKSTPINYIIQNREVDSTGTFKQRKITITSK